ncbi:MAG: O-antigen ligase family protein [Bryobacteraceae bacterium]|jgi:O-antigen ligase
MNEQNGAWPERAAWVLLCALVFSLPFEKGIQFPGLGTISHVLGLPAFLAGVVVVARRRGLRRSNAALLLAAAFVLWEGSTWLWSYSRPATVVRFATLAQLFAMTALIWELCRTRAAQLRLIQAYVAGAAVSSVWTILRAVLNRQTNWRRFATSGFDPNDLGITLAIAFAMALYLNIRLRGPAVWLARLAAAVCIEALLLTASRTALVAALASVVFVPLAWRCSTAAQRAATIVLLALLAAGPVLLVPLATRARLETLPEEATSGTLHDRTRIWKAGAKLFEQNPMLGVGFGAYPKEAYPLLRIHYNAHNTFLSVLVEAGVVGFVLWLLFLGVLVWFVRALPPRERALWYTTLMVWGVGVLAVAWEHRKPTWLIFALIMTAWANAFRPEERAP